MGSVKLELEVKSSINKENIIKLILESPEVVDRSQKQRSCYGRVSHLSGIVRPIRPPCRKTGTPTYTGQNFFIS